MCSKSWNTKTVHGLNDKRIFGILKHFVFDWLSFSRHRKQKMSFIVHAFDFARLVMGTAKLPLSCLNVERRRRHTEERMIIHTECSNG